MNVTPIPGTRRSAVGSLQDEDLDAAFEQVRSSRKPDRAVPAQWLEAA